MKKLEKTQVDKYLKEIRSHGKPTFPLQIYLDHLDHYDQGKMAWHWHPEVQIGFMVRGSSLQCVPEGQYTLHEGGGFFVNSNVLHEVRLQQQEAVIFTVVFSSSLLSGFLGSAMEEKYVAPITSNPNIKILLMNGEEEWHSQFIDSVKTIWNLCKKEETGYELLVVAELYRVWLRLYESCKPMLSPANSTVATKDDVRIKQMLDYIYSTYADAVSLESIAESANISPSECCRCFKRVLKTTPFGYLNRYRLTVASKLLRKGLSVTDVYKEVGYCSQSYFSTQFKSIYGCTPGYYRKNMK